MGIKREKDQSVETLRGAAIILVVIGHVIGSGSDGGMKVADDSFLRHFYYTFEYLRMPLFTVISGWVYALHPAKINDLQSFFVKKVRRILLPMIFVGTAYFLMQYFIPGTNKKGDLADIWRILVFPYTLFWYLPALFIVFIAVSFIDAFEKMKTFVNWAIILGFAICLLMFRGYYIQEGAANYFCYQGAIYLFPFFIIGLGIKRFSTFFADKKLNILLLVLLVGSLILQQLAWYGVIEYNLSKGSGVGLLIGVTGTVLLFRIKWNVKWLVWFGSYAYTIFLFHSFGTAGGRILTNRIGISEIVIVFSISLICGMFVPVLAEQVLDRFGITRMLFLGRSYNKNQKGD
ncbi:MAG: acyltransferase [Bacteroidetes bacterium]|nr:acyltransferase [Bacteroidota bacterium]